MRKFFGCTASLTALVTGGVLAIAVAFASESQPGITAEESLLRLKEGNEKFVADQPPAKDIESARRLETAKGQHPFAVIVTCADSRVPPEYIFDQGIGDLFVVRVAGNIADPYVIGSVEYAVEHLHVPLVVMLGHEKCGAVSAALSPEKPTGNLGKLVAEIEPGKLTGTGDAVLSSAIRNNAEKQVERMMARSEVLKTSVHEKKAKFVTGIYHLEDGRVEWLGE